MLAGSPTRLVVLGATLVVLLAVVLFNRDRMSAPAQPVLADLPAARSPVQPGQPLQVLVDEDGTATVQTEPAEMDSERKALVSGLFQGALLGAVDRTDFDQIPSYKRLLRGVLAMPAAEFSARATRRLDWTDAVEHPERWRGEFVKVRGLVAGMGAVKILGSDQGIEDVYRGYAIQPDGTEAVAFDCVEPPPSLDLNKDVVDIEGVFYRIVRYESKKDVMREVPWLIVRNLSVYQPPEPDHSLLAVTWKVLAVVAASALAAFALLRWSERRRPRGQQLPPPGTSIREMFESRRREQPKTPPAKNDERT